MRRRYLKLVTSLPREEETQLRVTGLHFAASKMAYNEWGRERVAKRHRRSAVESKWPQQDHRKKGKEEGRKEERKDL